MVLGGRGRGGGGAERGQGDGEVNVNVGLQGFSVPAMYSMWGAWAPTAERATLGQPVLQRSERRQLRRLSHRRPPLQVRLRRRLAFRLLRLGYVSGTSSGTSVRSRRSGACRCWRCSLVTIPVT